MNEEGIDSKTGKVVVKVDAKYFRPAEVEYVSSPPPALMPLSSPPLFLFSL